jgi:hypothetical protein
MVGIPDAGISHENALSAGISSVKNRNIYLYFCMMSKILGKLLIALMQTMIRITLIMIVPIDFRKGKIIAQYNSMKPATMILITPPH